MIDRLRVFMYSWAIFKHENSSTAYNIQQYTKYQKFRTRYSKSSK